MTLCIPSCTLYFRGNVGTIAPLHLRYEVGMRSIHRKGISILWPSCETYQG